MVSAKVLYIRINAFTIVLLNEKKNILSVAYIKFGKCLNSNINSFIFLLTAIQKNA